jgi:hypothetical protein
VQCRPLRPEVLLEISGLCGPTTLRKTLLDGHRKNFAHACGSWRLDQKVTHHQPHPPLLFSDTVTRPMLLFGSIQRACFTKYTELSLLLIRQRILCLDVTIALKGQPRPLVPQLLEGLLRQLGEPKPNEQTPRRRQVTRQGVRIAM